jgi:hypothetical protein
MSKVINHAQLTPTLALTECKDGFWLYDETRGFNLAMRAKTSTDAFVEALEYYQDRLKEVESQYSNLKAKVDSFVSNFVDEEGDY